MSRDYNQNIRLFQSSPKGCTLLTINISKHDVNWKSCVSTLLLQEIMPYKREMNKRLKMYMYYKNLIRCEDSYYIH